MTTDESEPAAPLRALQERLGYTFKRARLLEQAVTHSSFQGTGNGRRRSYERLEFLGDRVLGLIIADLLYRKFPGEEVGALARRSAALVRREALVQVAEVLGLADSLRLSRGEEDAGGRRNPGILADACEGVIAAVYVDGGLEAARAVVEQAWLALVERDASPPKDAKTLLQEWAQGLGLALPCYRETERSGPPHAPMFRVEVAIEGWPPVDATGPSKRVAERAAAELMLEKVLVHDGP